MSRYLAFFKCRLCGETFISAETIGRKTAEKAVIAAALGEPPEPNAPTLHDIHICGNGGMGIADFIGFRKEAEDV